MLVVGSITTYLEYEFEGGEIEFSEDLSFSATSPLEGFQPPLERGGEKWKREASFSFRSIRNHQFLRIFFVIVSAYEINSSPRHLLFRILSLVAHRLPNHINHQYPQTVTITMAISPQMYAQRPPFCKHGLSGLTLGLEPTWSSSLG